MRYDLDLDSGVVYPGTSMVDLAKVAEDCGFDAIWKGESNSADPMVSLSAMAVGTRTIKLGTAVYHVFGRTPVTLGIQAATLNDLSGGRVLIGLGVSNKTIAAWHDATFDRPLRRIREYSDIVRQVARGDRVEYDGDVYTTTPFKLSWRSSYPEVPIYFAGLGEQMTRLAGRYADGIMVNMANPSMLREIFGRVRESAAAAGRDPSTLEYIAKVRVCLHPDRASAIAKLKAALAFYNIADFYRDLIGQMGFAQESAHIREAYRESGFRAAQAAVPDSLIEELPTIAATTVDEARERLQPYLETGVTRLIIPYVAASDDAVGETRRFLESWAI
ncbi:MAG TPA: LLM class flavin-dependent oxidoreductase [Chloroflexota bacterium]|nr:LLM class flavin-dependent oxidoreductase [Chloroflexota bacterium]